MPLYSNRDREKNKKYTKDKKGAVAAERDRMLAVLFMDGADKQVFGFLMRIARRFLAGRCQVPG